MAATNPTVVQVNVGAHVRGVLMCCVMLLPGADEKQHFKHAFTSCEVLCCEVDQIYSTLIEDEALLTKLYSFLDNPKPLNLTKAGYFARVVLCLLVKRSSEMLSYLEAHPAIIQRLVDHIDTTSIAEVCPFPRGSVDRSYPAFLRQNGVNQNSACNNVSAYTFQTGRFLSDH